MSRLYRRALKQLAMHMYQVVQTLFSKDKVILIAISQKNIKGASKRRKLRPPPQGWDISPVRKGGDLLSLRFRSVAKDHKNGLKEVWVEGTDFIRLKVSDK